MKSLSEFIAEAATNVSDEDVYVVYFDDGTMYNYYMTEEEANKTKDSLDKECPANKCKVKKEKKSNFETLN